MRMASNPPADPLCPPVCTHIEVRCRSCGHAVELMPYQLPARISVHDFESRAQCGCGEVGPHVAQLPKVLKGW